MKQKVEEEKNEGTLPDYSYIHITYVYYIGRVTKTG